MYKEFFLQTLELKNVLGAVQGICQKKTIFDETGNIIFSLNEKENLIKATDGETSVEIYLNSIYSKNISEEIELSINAKRFFEIIKDLNDTEISIKIFHESISINSKFSKINLSLSSKKPNNEHFEKIENLFSIKKEKLLEMINFCMPLATTTASNSSINQNGIIFFELIDNNFSATSTDGHSLAHFLFINFKNSINKNLNFSISKRAASDLKKIFDLGLEDKEIVIGKTKNEIIFSTNQFTVFVKILVEKFPDYKKILKVDLHNKIEVNQDQFLSCLKRLSCMTAGKFIPSNMKVKNLKLTFDLENKEIGSIHEELEILNYNLFEKSEIGNLEISVHPPYLFQAATAIAHQKNDDTATLLLSSSKKPLILSHTSTEKQLYYIVMPMVCS